MISRYELSLNGVSLSSFHPSLMVLDIQYADPQFEIITAAMATRPGAYVTHQTAGSAAVKVLFELHCPDIKERRRTLDRITAWAMAGGTLQTSDRPEHILSVICTAPPALTAKDFTAPLSITFSAYNPPFWQDKIPAVTTGSSLYVPGSVPPSIARAQVDADITATAAITSCSIAIGSTTIALSGISIPSGGVIKIAHNNGILSIKYGNTSLLSKRTGDDDLLAECGKSNNISVTGSITAQCTARGLWI